MLQKHAHFNDLSTELRAKIEERVRSFGKKVRYRFNISNINPDPQKTNGDRVFPFMYVLDPCVYRIVDPYEKREGVSKSKEIGLVDKIDNEGRPTTFFKIKVWSRHQGVLNFDLSLEGDDFEFVMYLELHPKNKNGMFPDKSKQQLFERIDEQKDAKENRERREAKRKSLAAALQLSDDDTKIKQFAEAMLWDTDEDIDVLRDKIESMAENHPQMFNDLVGSKNLEYQSLIKRAIDKEVLGFDSVEYKFHWPSGQTITMLSPGGERNHLEKFSEWLQTNGQKGDEVYKKIKSLAK